MIWLINDEGQILPGIPRINCGETVLDFKLEIQSKTRKYLKNIIIGEKIISVKKQFPFKHFI